MAKDHWMVGILGIVAVVAIVGMVIMFTGVSKITTTGEAKDIGGGASYWDLEYADAGKGICCGEGGDCNDAKDEDACEALNSQSNWDCRWSTTYKNCNHVGVCCTKDPSKTPQSDCGTKSKFLCKGDCGWFQGYYFGDDCDKYGGLQ